MAQGEAREDLEVTERLVAPLHLRNRHGVPLCEPAELAVQDAGAVDGYALVEGDNVRAAWRTGLSEPSARPSDTEACHYP